jgi:hypothetical protein
LTFDTLQQFRTAFTTYYHFPHHCRDVCRPDVGGQLVAHRRFRGSFQTLCPEITSATSHQTPHSLSSHHPHDLNTCVTPILLYEASACPACCHGTTIFTGGNTHPAALMQVRERPRVCESKTPHSRSVPPAIVTLRRESAHR